MRSNRKFMTFPEIQFLPKGNFFFFGFAWRKKPRVSDVFGIYLRKDSK